MLVGGSAPMNTRVYEAERTLVSIVSPPLPLPFLAECDITPSLAACNPPSEIEVERQSRDGGDGIAGARAG